MLNAGFKRIAAVRELDPATVSTGDGYLRLMLRFAAVAEDRIASVRDKVRLAESRYEATLRFYGEPAQQSDTFFALFQVFVTSYKRVKADNAHRAATERRRKVRRAVSLSHTDALRSNSKRRRRPRRPRRRCSAPIARSSTMSSSSCARAR